MNATLKKLGISLLVLLSSCGTYTDKKVYTVSVFPELGSIVRTASGQEKAIKESVGLPIWESPVKVSVQELPFSKAGYKEYLHNSARTGKKSPKVDWDSLKISPTYLRLQLADKIALATHLNRESNAKVRAYIAKDSKAKLVTSVDAVVSDTLLPVFRKARLVLLTQDQHKNTSLLVRNGKQSRVIPLHSMTVFNGKSVSLCWETDRYGAVTVAHLTSEGQKCPEGTYGKASEIQKEKAYFKL